MSGAEKKSGKPETVEEEAVQGVSAAPAVAPAAEAAKDDANAPADAEKAALVEPGLEAHVATLVADALANITPEFVARVAAEIKAQTAPDPDAPMPDSIKTQIAAYLDANLPDLVAAAIPEAPEVVAQEVAAQAAAAAAEEREKQAKADAKAAAKAEKAAIERRAAQIEAAQEAFDAAEGADPFDDLPAAYQALLEGALVVADNGDTFSVDFREHVDASTDLDLIEGRGILLRTALLLGEGDYPPFTIQAMNLVAKASEAQPLRCELVSSVTVGGGARGGFAANSLLFRIVPPISE